MSKTFFKRSSGWESYSQILREDPKKLQICSFDFQSLQAFLKEELLKELKKNLEANKFFELLRDSYKLL